MILEGVVIGGRVELQVPATLPEGSRVRFQLLPKGTMLEADGPPEETLTHEEELAELETAHREMLAGEGQPFAEFMAELARKHNLPPVTPES